MNDDTPESLSAVISILTLQSITIAEMKRDVSGILLQAGK